MNLILAFFVVSRFVPKLRKFKKNGARNTYLTDGTLITDGLGTTTRCPPSGDGYLHLEAGEWFVCDPANSAHAQTLKKMSQGGFEL